MPSTPQQIDTWKSRLLDLSRRNRLLHLRPGAALALTNPPAADLYGLLVRRRTLEFADALTPEQLRIAEQIHEGRIACELGTYVQITADARNPGYFNVQTKAQRYRMYPVVTATGAIRLEDQKVGAVWLQLANKSMLMNQKLGQRVADECMSPAQHAVAQALAAKPAPSLFEPATPPQQATAPAADGNTSVVYNK